MPLEITQREMNGIYVLALKGRLVLGQESSGLLTATESGPGERAWSHASPGTHLTLELRRYADFCGPIRSRAEDCLYSRR